MSLLNFLGDVYIIQSSLLPFNLYYFTKFIGPQKEKGIKKNKLNNAGKLETPNKKIKDGKPTQDQGASYKVGEREGLENMAVCLQHR